MAGFADAFSAENVQRLMSDPRLVLGLQLMQQSGPQPGNPSGGQRFGQAGVGAMQQIAQQQHAQQLQQYRQAQIQQAEQQRAFQIQQAQAKQEAEQRQRQALQDPSFQSSLGGLAKTLAGLGMPLDDVLKAQSGYQLQQHRDATLAQAQAHFEQTQANRGTGGGADHGPKMPAQRQIYEEPLPGNMVQRHMFDTTTGQYKPLGAPYPRFAPTKASPLDALMNDIMPDDNAGPGQAVPGLPGSNTTMAPAPQGADLLMRGSGSNPTPPIITGGANPLAAREGMRVPGQQSSSQYPGAPAVGTVRKGYKYLGGNPADKASWSKI